MMGCLSYMLLHMKHMYTLLWPNDNSFEKSFINIPNHLPWPLTMNVNMIKWQNDKTPQDIPRNLGYAKEYYFSNDLLDIWYQKL